MDNMTLIVLLLILMGVAYQLGLTRSRAVASNTTVAPAAHGWTAAARRRKRAGLAKR